MLLQKFIPQKIKVLRDSKEEIIDKKFLVPGDIVLLEAGDLAPADLRVINLQNFLVDESALTGESVPVSKITDALLREEKEIFKAKNIIFSGTSVISGKAQGSCCCHRKRYGFWRNCKNNFWHKKRKHL